MNRCFSADRIGTFTIAIVFSRLLADEIFYRVALADPKIAAPHTKLEMENKDGRCRSDQEIRHERC